MPDIGRGMSKKWLWEFAKVRLPCILLADTYLSGALECCDLFSFSPSHLHSIHSIDVAFSSSLLIAHALPDCSADDLITLTPPSSFGLAEKWYNLGALTALVEIKFYLIPRLGSDKREIQVPASQYHHFHFRSDHTACHCCDLTVALMS